MAYHIFWFFWEESCPAFAGPAVDILLDKLHGKTYRGCERNRNMGNFKYVCVKRKL